MTRKKRPYHPRPLTVPMLINRGLINTELETRERMLVEAFAGGWATKEHFDNIADMRNLLTLAAAYKDDKSAIAMSDAMRIPMNNIRLRFAQTGHFGVTGDELKLMRAFVEQYKDFWMRQPVKLYEMACDELTKAHDLGIMKVAA